MVERHYAFAVIEQSRRTYIHLGVCDSCTVRARFGDVRAGRTDGLVSVCPKPEWPQTSNPLNCLYGIAGLACEFDLSGWLFGNVPCTIQNNGGALGKYRGRGAGLCPAVAGG